MFKLNRMQTTRASVSGRGSTPGREKKTSQTDKGGRDIIDLDDVTNKAMPLEEFLLNFYRILIEFVNSEDELPKVFNLYVIRTKKVKADVEVFKRLYNNSLIFYRNDNPEVAHLVNLLKKQDKEALDFFIAGKQVLLRFFDMPHTRLSFPVARLGIPISDWMRILKSFWFFGVSKQTEKLDEFVRHVLNQNENYLTLNGVDFLIAVHNFYLRLREQDKLEEPERRQTLAFASAQAANVHSATSNLHLFGPRFEDKTLTIGKAAHKFQHKAEVVLPVKKERQDARGITSG